MLVQCRFNKVATSPRENRENVIMVIKESFNIHGCLAFGITVIICELKCLFFYETLIKLWSVIGDDVDVPFWCRYLAEYNNKTMVILRCSLPQFLKTLYSCLRKHTGFVMIISHSFLLINNNGIWPQCCLTLGSITYINFSPLSFDYFFLLIPSTWWWIIMLVGICWLCSANLKIDCLKIWLGFTWLRWW